MQKFCFLLVLGVLALGPAWAFAWTPWSFAADGAASTEVVPFQLQRGRLIAVKCSVGGIKNLIGIIDTGVSETVLDVRLARRLSLATKADHATFINHQAKVWAVGIPGLQLGPLAVDRLEGIATDLSSLTAELGIGPQVLIGMDFLHRSNFVIDYRSRQLVFYLGAAPRLAHSAPLVSSVSEASEVSEVSERPPWRFAIIESSIGGHKVRLQVDSGFDGLLLYRERMPILLRGEESFAATLAQGESHIANVGQSLLARSTDSLRVRIGDWRAPNTQLLVDGPPPEWAPFDGLIGTAFLSQRRVAFDFQNSMVYWE